MKTDASFNEQFIYLDEIFVAEKPFSFKKKLLSIDQSAKPICTLNPEIIRQFEIKLGLSYLSEKTPEGNLCFANNREIRQEFKQVFTEQDILNYISAVLHSPIGKLQYQEYLKSEPAKIPYPKDIAFFWELVAIGSKIK